MKISILLTSLISFGQCSDMNVNQYNQIEFNNNLLTSIINSKGVSNQVNTFFSNSLNESTGSEPDNWIKYESSEVDMRFDDGEYNLMTGQMEYQLTIINIKSSQYAVKFNGITINVGDNVQVLGTNPPIITYNDGRRSACYKIGSESLAFYLSLNNTITSIQYQYFN